MFVYVCVCVWGGGGGGGGELMGEKDRPKIAAGRRMDKDEQKVVAKLC